MLNTSAAQKRFNEQIIKDMKIEKCVTLPGLVEFRGL